MPGLPGRTAAAGNHARCQHHRPAPVRPASCDVHRQLCADSPITHRSAEIIQVSNEATGECFHAARPSVTMRRALGPDQVAGVINEYTAYQEPASGHVRGHIRALHWRARHLPDRRPSRAHAASLLHPHHRGLIAGPAGEAHATHQEAVSDTGPSHRCWCHAGGIPAGRSRQHQPTTHEPGDGTIRQEVCGE